MHSLTTPLIVFSSGAVGVICAHHAFVLCGLLIYNEMSGI
jgi:hypothetical protein